MSTVGLISLAEVQAPHAVWDALGEPKPLLGLGEPSSDLEPQLCSFSRVFPASLLGAWPQKEKAFQ